MRSFLSSTGGAALVEYGLLAGLVAVVAIGSVSALGQKSSETFSDIAAELSAATASVSTAGEATGTELDLSLADWSWEIVAGTNPNAETTHGFYENAFGERTMLSGPSDVTVLQSALSANRSFFYIADDLSSTYTNYTLACDHGSWDMADVSSYSTAPGVTRFFWDNGTGPFFEPGLSYRCGLVAK